MSIRITHVKISSCSLSNVLVWQEAEIGAQKAISGMLGEALMRRMWLDFNYYIYALNVAFSSAFPAKLNNIVKHVEPSFSLRCALTTLAAV
jgi:hypothetical protein